MISFNNIPKDKPSQNSVAEGRYTASIFKTEMRVGKDAGTEYLNVSFKLDNGGFVNENYFDSDKPFLMYKLGRLLDACGVTLSGEGTLKDVAKVIKGKKVVVDVIINDKGYSALDYSNGHDGIYSIGEVEITAEPTAATLDPEITEAIEADVVDDDF